MYASATVPLLHELVDTKHNKVQRPQFRGGIKRNDSQVTKIKGLRMRDR